MEQKSRSNFSKSRGRPLFSLFKFIIPLFLLFAVQLQASTVERGTVETSIVIPSPFAGGDGTVSNPYQIADWTQFDNVRYNVDKFFVLNNNLDQNTAGYTTLASATANSGEGWVPISNFTGQFDGQGYAITGLTINRPFSSSQALFSLINNATLKNINLNAVNVTGFYLVAGLLTKADSSTIINCHVSGTISGGQNVGGLAGVIDSFTTIAASSSAGTVSASTYVAAGLVPRNNGTITNSYSIADVSAPEYIAGLVVDNSDGGQITNCYSSGAITFSNGFGVGGLVWNNMGEVSAGTVTNSYWDTQTSGLSYGDGGTGKTTAEMKTLSTFSGWDFAASAGVWKMQSGANQSYPYLQSKTYDVPFASPAVNPIPGLELGAATTTAPTASAQTFCAGATVANLVATGTDLKWYDVATGGTALATSTALTTATYYVSQTVNANESERTSVEVTVTTTDAPTAAPTQIYAGTATLADVTVMGTGILWYDAATAGTSLPTSITLQSGTTYYVSQTTNACESTRTAITVNKISEATQTFCTAATVQNLVSTPTSGTTASWFTTATGGTALATQSTLATGTYYVEQGTASSVVTLASAFNRPFGVAIQADGKILVADTYNNAIKRMNADGTNLETLGSGFNKPYDVAIQADGKIVVADTNNSAIKRMNADGTNLETLGSGFSRPSGVAIQADGKIVVADRNNNAIKRMNADGTNLVTLGSGFNKPRDVAIQADGKIVVADTGNSTIKRMNADGTTIETLGSGFDSPYGVAIQADGKIVAADTGNS